MGFDYEEDQYFSNYQQIYESIYSLFCLLNISWQINTLTFVKHSIMTAIPILSSSLILTRAYKSLTSFYDYQLLMLLRKDKMAFGSVLVFPGGKFQQNDLIVQHMYKLRHKLYATALRECFEETGIYISQDPIVRSQHFAQLIKLKLKFNSSYLIDQNRFPLNSVFQQLCKIVQPSRDMVPYIRLITVPILKRRYDTTFYLQQLNPMQYVNFLKYTEKDEWMDQTDKITMCRNQYDSYKWMTPSEILNAFYKGEADLAPPQFIILNTMLKYFKYRDLYARIKSFQGMQCNLSMAPNIVSLIKNQDQNTRQNYPYAAALIGDSEFPYEHAIDTQKVQYLKQQIFQWSNKRKGLRQGLNRFLFKAPKNFFKQDYRCECNVQQGLLSSFMDYQNTKWFLEKYQI